MNIEELFEKADFSKETDNVKAKIYKKIRLNDDVLFNVNGGGKTYPGENKIFIEDKTQNE